jgi:hypothetical protein
MSEHLIPLGYLPDWVDRLSEASKNLQDKLAKQARGEGINAYNQIKSGKYWEAAKSAHGAYTSFAGSVGVGVVTNFAKITLQTDTWDLFRLGDSLFKPTGGEIAKDVLRLINIIPIVCEVGAGAKAASSAAPKVLAATGEPLPAVRGALTEVEKILAVAQDGTC